MSDLLPVAVGGDDLAERDQRVAALERLAEEAASAETPERASEIMFKSRALAEILESAKAPYDEAWLAGKASVLAARKLGLLLLELSQEKTYVKGRAGCFPSERGTVIRQLFHSRGTAKHILRLATTDDGDFQRYIQDRGKIPSVHGALIATEGRKSLESRVRSDWMSQRRRRVGVKAPANPSVDEAYSLIVKALGHLDGAHGPQLIINQAMGALYDAEDLLKPLRGGYLTQDAA